MASNNSSSSSRESSSEQRQYASKRGQHPLTFQPAIDDHAELMVYLRRVNEQYSAHKANVLRYRNDSQLAIREQTDSAEYQQHTFNAGSAPSQVHTPPFSKMSHKSPFDVAHRKPPPNVQENSIYAPKGAANQARVASGATLSLPSRPPPYESFAGASSTPSEMPSSPERPHESPNAATASQRPPRPSTATASLAAVPKRRRSSNGKRSRKAKGGTPSGLKSPESIAPASAFALDGRSSSSGGLPTKSSGAAATAKNSSSLKAPPKSPTAATATAAPKRSRARPVKATKRRRASAVSAVLDEDSRARIKRVQAMEIDIYAPDPEQDAPPGETENERRKRLERIIGRRKRAKKFIEIDQYNKQISEVSETNQRIESENEAFRERIALLKQILENGETPDRDLLCLPDESSASSTGENPAAETKCDEQPQNPSMGSVTPQLASGSDKATSSSARRDLQNLLSVTQIENSASQSRPDEDRTSASYLGLSLARATNAQRRNLTQIENHGAPYSTSWDSQSMPQILSTVIQNQNHRQHHSVAQPPPAALVHQVVSSRGDLSDVSNLLLQQYFLGSGTSLFAFNNQQAPQQRQQSSPWSAASNLLQDNYVLAAALRQQQQPLLLNLPGSNSGASAVIPQQQLEELYALLQRNQRQNQNLPHQKRDE